VRLEVQAPSDVRVGEVFQAHIGIEANIPLRDLMFSIAYENSNLSLVSVSGGEFVRQSGIPSELNVDEPSDGNIEVVFRALNGSAATGWGRLAVLEFEAIRPGTSAIELRSIRSVDAGGSANTSVSVIHEPMTIH
jgi:hypothetical protein